jgi:hypothetical protein
VIDESSAFPISPFFILTVNMLYGSFENAVGMYVPNQVVTNYDLMKYGHSDEWIQERTV